MAAGKLLQFQTHRARMAGEQPARTLASHPVSGDPARERAPEPLVAATVIIPARDEAARLGATLEAHVEALRERYGNRFEILVMAHERADGAVAAAIEQARRCPRLRVFQTTEVVGKGGAVLEGFRRARGARVAFVDADGATAPASLVAALEGLDDHDVVIGSRRLPASQIAPAQPLARWALGWLFAATARWLFALPHGDPRCGVKAFRREVAWQLAGMVTERDWAFDVDLLVSAAALGLSVAEQPVTWADRPDARARVLPAAWQVTRALWRVKQRRRRHTRSVSARPREALS